ncbi:hypothetical protein N7454_003650 [Penicillium verhagenii]|nr:hypothetical protein N7454_003650 [Penicillium verhagenii]
MSANESTDVAVPVPEAVNGSVKADVEAPVAENQIETPKTVEVEDFPNSAADEAIRPPPLETSKPVKPAELTADQQAKYDSVLKTVSEWTTVPNTAEKNATTAPITDDERMWLTRECLLRYLRATKWNATEAENRLKLTLIWRREYGMEKLTPDYISIENETGKQVIMGFDNNGRPCLYLRPSKQNTEKSERQIHHLVYMLERVIDIMCPDQETLALVINFGESKSGQNASIGQARETLYILQNHYPERLGRALIINSPFYVWPFFKLITPFIDPQTREKIKYNEDLRKHVPAQQLLKSVGGDVEFEYDHSIYWPALSKLSEQHREAKRARWIQGGKVVGEFENYLKGENIPSASQATSTEN